MDGEQFYNGVTTDKNLLGVTAYLLSLAALWQILRLWRNASLPNRNRQLVAQCAVLGFGVWDLFTANSATSESCLMLGGFLMLVTTSRKLRGRPAAVHGLLLTVVLVGGLVKVTGADVAVFHLLGRKADLTGRASEIWPLLIPMAPNALVGAGFELSARPPFTKGMGRIPESLCQRGAQRLYRGVSAAGRGRDRSHTCDPCAWLSQRSLRVSHRSRHGQSNAGVRGNRCDI